MCCCCQFHLLPSRNGSRAEHSPSNTLAILRKERLPLMSFCQQTLTNFFSVSIPDAGVRAFSLFELRDGKLRDQVRVLLVFSSPRFTSPRFSSPRFTSPRFTSPRFTSPRFTSPRFASPRFTSPRFTSPLFTSPVQSGPVHEIQYAQSTMISCTFRTRGLKTKTAVFNSTR